jgi:hypothetical protein
MDDRLVTFGFLSVFHIIGAATMGSALRDAWRGLHGEKINVISTIIFVIWSAIFGCMPFFFGLRYALVGSQPLFLLGEIAVWSSAFLLILLARDRVSDFLRTFQQGDVSLITLGGVSFIIGAALVALGQRWLSGGLFLIVGAAFVASGLWRLFQEAD